MGACMDLSDDEVKQLYHLLYKLLGKIRPGEQDEHPSDQDK
jgi:hypothetical protein